MTIKYRTLLMTLTLILAGCSTKPPTESEAQPSENEQAAVAEDVENNDPNAGRYKLEDDVAPENPISVDHVEEASPSFEPYSTSGNRDYTLKGQRYKIIQDTADFTETGKASWYGAKFHGHLTSNGEVYDMYSMSAAHKTLPIPSYVKVTNTDNDASTVVRINDRGPFHDERIIDLSYAAAYKLDVIKTGTANVKIEVLNTPKKDSSGNRINLHPVYAVQFLTSAHKERTENVAIEVSKALSEETYLDKNDSQYRALVGPFDDYTLTQSVLKEVKALGYPSAFIKTISASLNEGNKI
ncbi:hypothetical protein BCU68_07685 [Vibrio sp. 10N.286.49.B3]|uniref:septal ring lytic transglycosylase RlpA family protein n=1 Tax=Vibrio sp. 10N.286.49.B3 TaxID=1880855 RepID=UPI000CC09D4A|nr:septal ring lytic transglycosylase RlpA family protein [Vibrio sp. 10N.286.49.B3]PMH37489.1 hypothetical protein BCU68_07685 [Vibrio sp. 10N.286.49.B3]